MGLVKTVVVGSGIGFLGASLLVFLFRRYWVPDALQETVTLALVLAVFTASNLAQEEAGLLAVTLMGVGIANQNFVSVRHIIEFKENLRVLLISALFILLAARLDLGVLFRLGWGEMAFLATLLFVVRPLSVAISTAGSGLTWRERLFLGWMAPRGIVAASVASVFAIRLGEMGHPRAEALVTITFLVIVATVVIYGLSAAPVARRLGVAQKSPQGVLIMGAQEWAREMAQALKSRGLAVRLADSDRRRISDANMQGLPTYYGSILSERALNEIDLNGIGRLLALTPNDEANALAALHFAEVFGREEVYQLMPSCERCEIEDIFSPRHLRARFLFSEKATYRYLSERHTFGSVIKTITLTETFGYESAQKLYGDNVIPLFLIDEDAKLKVVTPDAAPEPEPGQTLVCLVDPVKEGEARRPSPAAAGIGESGERG
jgi:Trk K+ transport system NAD-binding subunit